MLALKLLIVPAFLLAVSMAARRWGARAGILAGLPVVAGPILFVLTLERGASFASQAAVGSSGAVSASIAFSVAYAHTCIKQHWSIAALAGFIAWGVVGAVLLLLPGRILVYACAAFTTLLIAPALFPKASAAAFSYRPKSKELAARMLAGALLCYGVSAVSRHASPLVAGLLAVFPILALVLAVFSHCSASADYSVVLLRSMARGLFSFAAFCLTLSLSLGRWSVATSFSVAIIASLITQFIAASRLTGWSTGRQQAPLVGALRGPHSGPSYRER